MTRSNLYVKNGTPDVINSLSAAEETVAASPFSPRKAKRLSNAALSSLEKSSESVLRRRSDVRGQGTESCRQSEATSMWCIRIDRLASHAGGLPRTLAPTA